MTRSVSASSRSARLSSGASAVRRRGWLSLLSRSLPLLACGLLLPRSPICAAEFTASDGARGDFFGWSAGLSGNTGIIGAYYCNIGTFAISGSAYLFRDLDTASSTTTQTAKLTASDGATNGFFGWSSSVSGNTSLIGANGDAKSRGSVYLFRNLDSTNGTRTEDAKLIASDGAAGDFFGNSVSLSGNNGLIGAYHHDIGSASNRGSAYLFRNLDSTIGTRTEAAKLTASDGAADDRFGWSASLSGNTGLIGAVFDNIGPMADAGSVYLFRNLDTASGSRTQDAKLIASDGATDDHFGRSVSLSENVGLIGAHLDDIGTLFDAGSAYLFRNLDTALGTVMETARLTASDRVWKARFGGSVSLSGNTCLIGAAYRSNSRGAAYFFRDLDTASGTITEQLRFTSDESDTRPSFGSSVVLDGDRFVIGAHTGDGATADSGKAYSGRVSAFTILDEDGVTRATDRLSFVSQDDWVIGQSTDGNQNTLSAGDTGTVSASGKGVYVGRAAGADNNKLTVAGVLTANFVQVGAAGNTGNALRISASGTVTASGGVTAASGSIVGGDGTITGNLTLASGAFFAFLPSATLTVTGSVALPAGFGVTGLLGLDGGTPAGTYGLLDRTGTNFAGMGLAHWGQENAHSLGDGKTAWFQQQGAGLQLVVEGMGTGETELPALNVSRNGAQLTLTWSATRTDLIPESSSALTGDWQSITTVPAWSGNNRSLTVPISETRRFYRLRRP